MLLLVDIKPIYIFTLIYIYIYLHIYNVCVFAMCLRLLHRLVSGPAKPVPTLAHTQLMHVKVFSISYSLLYLYRSLLDAPALIVIHIGVRVGGLLAVHVGEFAESWPKVGQIIEIEITIVGARGETG